MTLVFWPNISINASLAYNFGCSGVQFIQRYYVCLFRAYYTWCQIAGNTISRAFDWLCFDSVPQTEATGKPRKIWYPGVKSFPSGCEWTFRPWIKNLNPQKRYYLFILWINLLCCTSIEEDYELFSWGIQFRFVCSFRPTSKVARHIGKFYRSA